jgi:glycine/D-amino acid oxidase-like deaminating enzyme
MIGFDANLDNLVHAAGFSGHGLMHAPITALLVEAIITGDVEDGQHVRLQQPFEKHSIDTNAFAPTRSFTPSKKEALVL